MFQKVEKCQGRKLPQIKTNLQNLAHNLWKKTSIFWNEKSHFWSVAPFQFYRRHIIESIVGRRSFHSSSLTNSHSLGLLVMLYCHCLLLLHHRHFDDVAKVVLPWCHLKPKSASSSASSRQNFFLTSPKDAEQKKRNPGRRRRQAYGRSTRQLQLNRTTCCHLS